MSEEHREYTPIESEEQAVDALLEDRINEVITYLRAHKDSDNHDDGDSVAMFCLAVTQKFRPGDPSGVIDLSKVIRQLL